MQIKKPKRTKIKRINVAMLKPPHEHLTPVKDDDVSYALPYVSHEDMKIHELDCIPELYILLSDPRNQNLFTRGRHWIFLIQDMDPKSDTYKQVVNMDVCPTGDHLLEFGTFTPETSPFSQTEVVMTVSAKGGIAIQKMPQQWTSSEVEALLDTIDGMSEISDDYKKNKIGDFEVSRVDSGKREVTIKLGGGSRKNAPELPPTTL